jgi:hypothetical protein
MLKEGTTRNKAHPIVIYTKNDSCSEGIEKCSREYKKMHVKEEDLRF